MIILPYEKITLRTALDSQQILGRLEAEVDFSKQTLALRWSRMFSNDPHKFFAGTIDGSNFKISRIINYRNSFLPVIIGKIEGSTVEITLRTAIFINIFMAFWLGAAGYAAVYEFNHYQHKSFLPPGLMFLFGLLLWLICFRVEAEIAKKKLKAILGVS
jgi:hypothetical protein